MEGVSWPSFSNAEFQTCELFVTCSTRAFSSNWPQI